MNVQQMHEIEYCDAKAAAEILGISADTVRRWARDGKLTHVRLPSGRVRYRKVDILALLAPVEAQGEDLDLFLDVPFPALAGGRF